jgi:hypothetical protein
MDFRDPGAFRAISAANAPGSGKSNAGLRAEMPLWAPARVGQETSAKQKGLLGAARVAGA